MQKYATYNFITNIDLSKHETNLYVAGIFTIALNKYVNAEIPF